MASPWAEVHGAFHVVLLRIYTYIITWNNNAHTYIHICPGIIRRKWLALMIGLTLTSVSKCQVSRLQE